MRYEIEAMRDVRSLMLARCEAIEGDAAYDYPSEVVSTLAALARLVRAKVVGQADWEMVLAHDLRPGEWFGEPGRSLRSLLKAGILNRLQHPDLAFTDIEASRANSYVDDVVSLLFEAAAIRRPLRPAQA